MIDERQDRCVIDQHRAQFDSYLKPFYFPMLAMLSEDDKTYYTTFENPQNSVIKGRLDQDRTMPRDLLLIVTHDIGS